MPNFVQGIIRQTSSTAGRWLFAFLLGLFAFQPALISQAQTTGGQTVIYRPAVLTAANNSALYVEIQAVSFAAGKWTYQVNYRRTLDTLGSLYISPKLDKNAPLALNCLTSASAAGETPAQNNGTSLKRVGNCTFSMNPGTRYRLEFYSQASAGGQLLLRKFFNTLDANGNGVPDNKAIGGTDANGNLITAINPSTGAIVSVITPTTGASTTPATQIPPVNSTSPCVGSNDTRSVCTGFDLLRLASKETNPEGLAAGIEPIKVDTFNKTNPGPKSSTLGYPTDPSTGNLVQNTSSAPCWNGTSDPYSTCDQSRKFVNGDYQEIWVGATTGRKFISDIQGTNCLDVNPNLKIDKNLNFPPGINMGPCHSFSDSGFIGYAWDLSGTPTQSGIYKTEFRVTKTVNGVAKTALTRIYFMVIDHGTMDVTFVKTDGTNAPTNSAALSSRVAIMVGQTKNITTWTDIDFWAVQGTQSTTQNPEGLPNKILIGRYTVDEGWQGCNASTAGGAGAYAFGCSRFNWQVGQTLGANLGTGPYTIYAVSHLPNIDRNGSYIGRLYGNCQIGFTNTNGQGTSCNGFAWGGAVINITPGEALPTVPTYNQGTANLASFSMLTISATSTIHSANGSIRKQTASSIGESGTDNAKVNSCMSGNDSGGVDCPGPLTDTNLKAGEYLEFEWSFGVPNQSYIDVRSPKAATADCNVVSVADSGGYWQGGDGMDCGRGTPIGGILARRGKPAAFSGGVDSTIQARGDVIDLYAGPTDTKATLVRQCTDFLIPGGFDYMPGQGYINSPSGKYISKPISAACASILRGVQISQWVNVYINLNGGGSTHAGYMMGGMDFGGSCVGVNDADLCSLASQQIMGSGFFGRRPALGTQPPFPAGQYCNIPDESVITDRLGLNQGLYPDGAGDPGSGILVEFLPFSGNNLKYGWIFDKAEITVSGNGYSRTMDLGNSSDPRWNKNLVSGGTIGGKSIACYYSALNCGNVTWVSTPEFTGLRPASLYSITMRFTCNGTNTDANSGGKNYRDVTVYATTGNLGNGNVNIPSETTTTTPPAGGSSACSVTERCSSNYKFCKATHITYSDAACQQATGADYVYDASCNTCNGNTPCPDGSLPGGKCPNPANSGTQTQPNYFSASSGCYLPTDYETQVGVNCSKSGSTVTGGFKIPANAKYDSVALFGDTLSKVGSGCAGGPCFYSNWNASTSFNIPNIPTTFTSSNPFWTRVIFYCKADPKGYASAGVQCN